MGVAVTKKLKKKCLQNKNFVFFLKENGVDVEHIFLVSGSMADRTMIYMNIKTGSPPQWTLLPQLFDFKFKITALHQTPYINGK